MKDRLINFFGSEWFGMAIATLAVAQTFFLASRYMENITLKYTGEIFFYLGIIIFLVIFILWTIRGLTIHDKKWSHWNNLTRLSFIALVPIILFVINHITIELYGINELMARLSLYNYFFSYFLALILGVLLGYRIYTKEINRNEINYAIIIPPLSIGTSIFLATPLIGYYHGTIAESIYFLVLMGLGIFFFLYIFIGSVALSGHVSNKSGSSLPTAMLPVGVSSLIIINLISINSFGAVIDHLPFSIYTVEFVSILLWGFEVWNFLVMMIIVFRKETFGYLSVWAYGFPLGLFATSTIKLEEVTKIVILGNIFIFIWVALVLLWFYGILNTYVFIRRGILGSHPDK
ncbi:C4-dicarboxylate ABC transporter [Picrophilus oshimae]|uniref:C4-dicarboxylate transporter n=1 Tax=Picrophilus torridus (strain ATCC 700027 / DSM 9790 / JCM 10055 / NBRC 100828 / KAW 2/3) TaxID=1122961 RepID=Q6L253_PICTO|nr:C4-dicarboxylate ABC transporter [Picrophilus oshimae]AAT42949.1 C4-dicarboxylate transporter [Picrophilus oshimae DSM 9789]